MLIDEPRVSVTDPILAVIAKVGGHAAEAVRIQKGVYEVGHFGSTHFLRDWEHYPEGLSVESYGVCDNVGQLLAKCPELEASERKFVVTVTRLLKRAQPANGGWRWHKWGPYIGEQNPQCEHLYDEPVIEQVLVYHIYEKVEVPRA